MHSEYLTSEMACLGGKGGREREGGREEIKKGKGEKGGRREGSK